jgi:phospholipid-binding lipoprotein MlaA
VSGCGTLSGGLSNESTLLASSTLPPITAASRDGEAPAAPDPVAAAVSAETRVETTESARPSGNDVATAGSTPSFLPVAFEPITPGSSASYLAEPVLAQRRGAAEPASDAQIEEYDPWEPFNEKMFRFNYNFDRYLLKPVAKGYNVIVPDRVQQMIDHGFDNIKVVPRLVNNMLQWKWKAFSTELGRFLINSTFGIGGLFDIAKQEFGLEKPKGADFGVTLGKWGSEPGPFLILPFLPPLTVRDGIGYAVDGLMDPLSYVLPFFPDRLAMKIGETINERSLNLDLFQGFEETTVDLYSAVRNGYLQRRYNLIYEGK